MATGAQTSGARASSCCQSRPGVGRFIPADVSSFSVLPRSAPPAHLQSPVKRSESGPPAYAVRRCRGVTPTRCSDPTKLGCGTSPTRKTSQLACGGGRADTAGLPLDRAAAEPPLLSTVCTPPPQRLQRNVQHRARVRKGSVAGRGHPAHGPPLGKGTTTTRRATPWGGPRGTRVTRDVNWNCPRLFARSRSSVPPERRREEHAGWATQSNQYTGAAKRRLQ